MEEMLWKYFLPIKEIVLANETSIEENTLKLNENITEQALKQADSSIVKDMSLSIIYPNQRNTLINTVLDVSPIAVKLGNDRLGQSKTLVLDGLVLMLTGLDEDGQQISEADSSDGNMKETICFNRAGSIDDEDIVIRIDFLIAAGKRMTRQGPLECHKAADKIIEEIKKEVKGFPIENLAKLNYEQITHERRSNKPKVLIVKEIMGQGGMHEKLLLPEEPCGVAGARSNIDMGNVPVMFSPLEAIDGGIHALTCVGPSTKETTRHYFRDPLIYEALQCEKIYLCGCVFVGSPAFSKQKEQIAERLGVLAQTMDLDGVIVQTEERKS